MVSYSSDPIVVEFMDKDRVVNSVESFHKIHNKIVRLFCLGHIVINLICVPKKLGLA